MDGGGLVFAHESVCEELRAARRPIGLSWDPQQEVVLYRDSRANAWPWNFSHYVNHPPLRRPAELHTASKGSEFPLFPELFFRRTCVPFCDNSHTHRCCPKSFVAMRAAFSFFYLFWVFFALESAASFRKHYTTSACSPARQHMFQKRNTELVKFQKCSDEHLHFPPHCTQLSSQQYFQCWTFFYLTKGKAKTVALGCHKCNFTRSGDILRMDSCLVLVWSGCLRCSAALVNP